MFLLHISADIVLILFFSVLAAILNLKYAPSLKMLKIGVVGPITYFYPMASDLASKKWIFEFYRKF